ncbi:hypothetical protein N0V88_000045 [Collariella sp. IMI 366227]|nr:hypothetical protein N0V88_000045 [Collariella sp. IMI 366227]
MKAAILAIVALAGAVVADEFPSNMPECGKNCGRGVLGQHDIYGCSQDDVVCMCKNQDFGYGIHDCSVQICGSLDDANAAIEWGNNLCANAQNPINLPSATALGSNINPSASASEVVTTIISGSSTFVTTSTVESESDEETSTATPITSTWTSVFTSGDVTTTMTGETTVSGISGIAGATSVPETTITSEIVSTKTEDSTTFETTIGTTTFVSSYTGDALSSALSSQASEASSTSSGNDAQMTAAPVFGILAAAGIAAALL